MSMNSLSDFYEEVRNVLRLKHYSIHTEETYLSTIRHYIDFHGKRHPKNLGVPEIRAYLSHLATVGNVAAATQNVAFNALIFLYRDVLDITLPTIEGVERAKRPERLPAVLTRPEVKAVFSQLSGTELLMASLLYGSGLPGDGMSAVAG